MVFFEGGKDCFLPSDVPHYSGRPHLVELTLCSTSRSSSGEIKLMAKLTAQAKELVQRWQVIQSGETRCKIMFARDSWERAPFQENWQERNINPRNLMATKGRHQRQHEQIDRNWGLGDILKQWVQPCLLPGFLSHTSQASPFII